jgi:hypothetical protein
MNPDIAFSGPRPVWSTHGARRPCACSERNVLVELPLPGGAVPRRETVELGDVRLERRLEEHRLSVRERGGCRQVRVQVLEAAAVEVVGELGVCGRALEERVP